MYTVYTYCLGVTVRDLWLSRNKHLLVQYMYTVYTYCFGATVKD